MSLTKLGYGENAPEEFNVVIEIPMNSDPVKYEVDDSTGLIMVDRFMLAAITRVTMAMCLKPSLKMVIRLMCWCYHLSPFKWVR